MAINLGPLGNNESQSESISRPVSEKAVQGFDSILFIDSPAEGNLVLDFPKYVNTISRMIENSTPKFNVGIFGGWGTGKTTLMLNIEETLENKDVRCLNFNAWRYQNESTHATIPLMLTIITDLYKRKEIQRILDQPSKNMQPETTQEQKREESWRSKIKRILRGLSVNVNFGIPGLVDVGIGYEPPNEESASVQQDEKSPYEIGRAPLSKTTLQEGLDLIVALLNEIPGPDHSLRLVVFIDDLDRCTPEKAIEVFESIKVFFEIKGIVFVLGLSNEIVELAINEKYKYLEGYFSGQDYLKKIIQLPFTIPSWQERDVEAFLDVILKSYKHKKYKKIFQDHKNLVLQAVENNPREVKRFLNHFIIAYDIYGKEKGIEEAKLLAVQAIRLRWNWFLDMLLESDVANNLAIVQSAIKLSDEQKRGIITSKEDSDLLSQIPDKKASKTTKGKTTKKKNEFNASDFYGGAIGRRVLEDESLMKFLEGEGAIIFKITKNQWPLYRRAGVAEVEFPSEKVETIQSQARKYGIKTVREEIDHLTANVDNARFHITSQIELARKEGRVRDPKLRNLRDQLTKIYRSIRMAEKLHDQSLMWDRISRLKRDFSRLDKQYSLSKFEYMYPENRE